MGSKGSTTTTNQTSTYDPTGSNYLNQALNQASSAAQNPYQAYTGELTAGINGQQNSAINNINSAANSAQPAYNQALGLLSSASAPISASQIAQYESPYTQQVVNATQAQFNNQNAQQQQQVTGNAALQGALGGDRVGVAQGITAGQQQLAQAPVIAQLQNQGYQTALSTAQQQQQNQENAALGLGSLGTGAQNAALSGAAAQLGAGTLQQQTQQAADTANYQQFQNQQSYPFQTAQFLSSIVGSLAPSLGGTTTGSGSQTAQGPNLLSQLLGLGTAGLGAFAASDVRFKHDIEPVGKLFDGTNLYRFKYHGDPRTHIGVLAQEVENDKPKSVAHDLSGLKYVDYEKVTDKSADAAKPKPEGFAMGGMPYGGGTGYVPTVSGMPSPKVQQPQLPSMSSGQTAQQQQQQTNQTGQALGKLIPAIGNTSIGGQTIKSSIFGNPGSPGLGQSSPGAGSSDPTSPAFVGPSPDQTAANAIPLGGDFGGMDFAARGGFIKGYDDGGGVPLDDTPPVPSPSIIPASIVPQGNDAALAPPSAPAPSAPPVPVNALAPAPGSTDLAVPVQVADNSAASGTASDANPMHVPSLGDIFKQAEQKYGLPSGYLAHTAKTESNFDPNNTNATSGAAGLFQFMPRTAAEYGLKNPYDPVASTDAAARLAANNMATLRTRLNRDPTPGEIYLAHQQGAGGASALLSNPNATAASVVGYKAVYDNLPDSLKKSAGTMSAAQFAARWAPDSPVLPQSGGSAMSFNADTSAAANRGLPSEIMNGASASATPPVPDKSGNPFKAIANGINSMFASDNASGTPSKSANNAAAKDNEQGSLGGLIPHLSPEAKQGLMAAGFGMMASRSPWIGTAIGEGGLQGASAYQKAQELSQKGELAKAQIANYSAEAQKNQIAADQAKQSMQMRQQIMNSPLFGGSGTPGVSPTTTTPDGKTVPVAQPPLGVTINKDLQTVNAAAGVSPDGQTIVNRAGQPLENLAVLQQRAQILMRTLDPELMKTGQAIQEHVDNIVKSGTQIAADGTVIPLTGAAESAARAAQMKTQAETRAASEKEGVHFDAAGNASEVPGFGPTVAGIAGQKESATANAQHQAAAKYDFVHIQPVPGGPVYQVSKADLAAGNYPGGPNYKPQGGAQQPATAPDQAGQPSAPATGGPAVGEQPKVFEKRQEAVAKNYDTMSDQFHARQVARERLTEIQEILKEFQPGQFAQQKADFVAKLRGVGFPIGDSDTANPALFEQFLKNATKNVFDDVKGMGGRVLVSEIQGLTKANANPELQPAAARDIVGQGIGMLNYEDQRYADFAKWYKSNPTAYDTSDFETQWAKDNPARKYTLAAQNATPVLGELPSAEKRVDGRTYMTPNGPATWFKGKGWKLETPPDQGGPQ